MQIDIICAGCFSPAIILDSININKDMELYKWHLDTEISELRGSCEDCGSTQLKFMITDIHINGVKNECV